MIVTTISVLICTYNRARLLRETLAALQTQKPPVDCRVEIIVVDNNSTDNTPAVVAESAADGTFPILSLHETRQGKSFALNTGLAHASGEVLALTDDDVTPAPDWLRRIVDQFRARDVVFVFGKVLPRWSRTPPPELLTAPAQDIWGPLAIVDYGDAPAEYRPESHSQRLPVGANLAFARSALVTIGGWRTDLGKVNNTLVSGEDHEIFMRLRRFGLYAGCYDPQLSVRHFVPASRLTREYFRRWFYWHGKTQALMLDDLYPELDMKTVPRIAAVPRFAYRQGVRQFWRWLTTRGSRDAVNALAEELILIEYAGLFAMCWRRWLTHQQPPSRARVGSPSTVGTTIGRMMIVGALLGAMMTIALLAAPRVHLSIQDGRVWLTADRASVAEILAEWARVGQTKVANGERVQGGPLSLQLTGMPEAAALDLLLRSAGGYVAVEREASRWTAPTMSRYGRIVVVPASAGPADAVRFAATPPPAPAFVAPTPAAPVPDAIETAPGVRRLIGFDGLPIPDDQEGAPPPPVRTGTTSPAGRGAKP